MPFKKLQDYFYSFAPLTDAEWEAQVQHLSVKHLKKGDFLVKEGQICTQMNFINTGAFRKYNLKDGKEVTTNFFFRGFVTDFKSLVTKQATHEYIQAMEDAEIVTIPYARLQELYDQYYNYQKFGRLIIEKVFLSLYTRQQGFLMLSPKERYLNLLQKRPKILQYAAQIHVASYLGITPEYLSRLRREIKLKQ